MQSPVFFLYVKSSISLFNESHMAVAPVCFKKGYKYQTVNKGCFISSTMDQQTFGGNTPISNQRVITASVCYHYDGTLLKANKSRLNFAYHLRSISANASEREKFSKFTPASDSREKQLRSLNSYFKKSKNDTNQNSSPCSLNNDGDAHNLSSKERAVGTVDTNFGEVDKSGQFKEEREPPSDARLEDFFSAAIFPVSNEQGTKAKVDDLGGSKSDYDGGSGLYIIGMMASINIAVYIFEIASPIKNSDLELFSLPALYGAKINHLILYGEWWRLFTPMFLHTGILHVGLSCWALLTFGPQVSRAYGPFTFSLIYILGGLSGNLTSFLHTPGPTVGGTGPVFAVIGAWLIYQYQNKEAISKDVFESMYQKAIVATALGFVLSTFGPIDDWTHFGSAFTGIAYGFVTCPALQIGDSSSSSGETGEDNGIRLIERNVDPCKSLLLFSVFIIILSSLLVIFEPPLGSVSIEDTLM